MNMNTTITPDEAIKLLGLATKPRVLKEIELSVAPDMTDKFLEANRMAIDALKKQINALPPAEPKRMHAKWIATTSLQKGQITWIDYKCSNCSHHRSKPMNFCEICGAKMERGEMIK